MYLPVLEAEQSLACAMPRSQVVSAASKLISQIQANLVIVETEDSTG